MFERVIEQGVNRVLAMDPASSERLKAFGGKRVELRLDGIPRSLVIEFDSAGSVFVDSLTPADVEDVDAVLSGSPFSFARAAASQRDAASGGAPAALGIRFEGDVGLAQGVSTLLKDIDVDLEDELAQSIGDAPAYHVSRLVRGLSGLLRDTGDRLRDNVGEFIREESGQSVYPDELETFLDDVDTLRADVERIERRIAQVAIRGLRA